MNKKKTNIKNLKKSYDSNGYVVLKYLSKEKAQEIKEKY